MRKILLALVVVGLLATGAWASESWVGPVKVSAVSFVGTRVEVTFDDGYTGHFHLDNGADAYPLQPVMANYLVTALEKQQDVYYVKDSTTSLYSGLRFGNKP